MKFAKKGNSFTRPTQFNKQMSFQIDKPFFIYIKQKDLLSKLIICSANNSLCLAWPFESVSIG